MQKKAFYATFYINKCLLNIFEFLNNMLKGILSVLAIFIFINCYSKKPFSTNPQNQKIVQETEKPIFKKNNGQWDNEILYRLSSGETSIAFYKNKIQFGLRKVGHQKAKDGQHPEVSYLVWDLVIENNNESHAVLGSRQQPSKINYFIGNSGKSIELQEFEQLTYHNIYPNIDLVFHLDVNRVMKYDFVVKPGGDLTAIKLRYDGIKKLNKDSRGNLVITTPWNHKLKEGKPVSWQIINGKKVKVEIDYVVSSKTLCYKANETISPNSTLIIDPLMLDWSTYFYGKVGTTGWGYTYVMDMDIDKDNSVYLTGFTTERFPMKVGTYDTIPTGTNTWDGFVAKMSVNGDSLLYFTYIGGSSFSYILSIAVNTQKQPVVSGFTYAKDFPVTSNAYDKTGGNSSGYRGFITKFSSDYKTLVFSTYFGKSNTWGTVIQSMQLTANGDIVFTGNTNASDFPVTTGCFQSTYGGGANDAFLTRLSADGSKLVYSTFFGGTGDDKATDISINATEDVYIVGSTSNSNFPLTMGAQGPFKYSNSDIMDGFVARIQYDGKKLIWSKMMGGSASDYFEGLYVNSNDELYIGGYSNSSNFYVTANALQATNNGGYDHVIVKMNKAGTNLYYSTYLGGGNDDYFYSGYWWTSNIRITANVKDEAIIGGITKSFNYPITADALQNKNNSKGASSWASNVAITKLSYDGSQLLYGTYFGGSEFEWPTVLKVKKISCMSSILYGGITASKDYPTTGGVFKEKAKNSTGWSYSGFMSRFRDTLYTEPIGFKSNFVECDMVFEILDAKNRGAEYLWSDKSKRQNLIVTDTGTYWVRATYGCDTVSDTITLKLQYSPVLNLKDDTTLCNNTTGYNLDAKNDTILRKYLWSTSDTTQIINTKTPGLYWVTVSTPNCGSITDSTELTFLKSPNITNIKDSVFCDAINWLVKTDSLGIGTTYNWSTNDTNLSTLITKTGNYFLKVKNYCGQDSVFFKTELLITPVAKLPKDTLVCDIFSLTYKVGRANNEEYYLWFDPINKVGYGIKDTFSMNTKGLWAVSVKNKCGIAIDSIQIEQRLTPKLSLGKDTVYCGNMSKVLAIGLSKNDETYLWNTANTTNTQTIINPGIYWARIKNICGQVSDTIQFTQKNSLKIDLGNDSIFCNTISKSFDISQPDPDALYTWHDANNGKLYTSTKPEKIWASISNLCGVVSDTVVFSLLNTPTVNLGKDFVFCDVVTPVSLTVGKLLNGETYLWSNTKITPITEFANAGKHWVQIKNKCGIASDTMVIVLVNSPLVSIGPDTSLCGIFNLPLNAQNPGLAYYWEPTGETTQKIIAHQQVNYKVTVTDANGCFGFDELQVKDDCKSKWYIPNSFTPNGDLLNDNFAPIFLNCENYKIQIFNNWGEKLFESSDPFQHWDGYYHGKLVQDDTYIYTIHFKSSEDKKWYNINGGVLLLN